VSNDLKLRIDELADLMVRYRLGEAEVAGDGWRVAFARRPVVPSVVGTDHVEPEIVEEQKPAMIVEGIPINSPMTGIYYASSSPSAPDFVQVGDTVAAGQVVALIEAMKVFNEITSPVSGVVRKVVAKAGEVVSSGEPLMFVG
jgi:biotin carboxyl carrier protein